MSTPSVHSDKEHSEESKVKGNIRFYQGKQYDLTDPRFVGKSKSAIKKILKEEIWEEQRPGRTKAKREFNKRKRDERRKLVGEGILEPLSKKRRAKDMKVGNIGIIFDCAFSSLMNFKELASLRQQLVRSYSANVRAEKESMKITLTSLDEPLSKLLDTRSPSWKNWNHFEATSDSYLDKFNKDDLVYLTADSDNVIHELEGGKTYIIGGIVDKNRHKNLCCKKAEEQGIKTGQLPIGEYIRLNSRKVLTINQVTEIMVKWLDCRDWEKAFMEIIPGRKLQDVHGEDEDEEDEDDEEESENKEGEKNEEEEESENKEEEKKEEEGEKEKDVAMESEGVDIQFRVTEDEK
ncbi:guanine-1-methyltransferase-domain-containing protein [Pilobolus umbonatus]|nr:guanine-1-methyltransferase-domain-containing protein [Pilobolus umbonatus]